MRVLDLYTVIAGGADTWKLAVFGSVVILSVGMTFLALKSDNRWGAVLMVVFAMGFLVLLAQEVKVPTVETVRMKVTMEEQVDIYEFLSEYKIIDRQGAILVLEPIDQEGYEK